MGKKKAIIMGTVIMIAVVGASFYAGMRYDSYKKGNLAGQWQNSPRMMQGMNGDSNRQGGKFQQQDGNGNRQRPGGRQGDMGGFIAGQIISKDDKSFTIKTPDGGSRIVFLSEQTSVAKADKAGPNDLEVGKEVTVNGKLSPDGSISAQNVQIKPAQ